MKNSRKELIAQINKLADELNTQREQVKEHQYKLSKSIAPILGFILAISTFIFLFRSKSSFKKVGKAIFSAGQVLLLTYFRKKIAQLLAKQS